MSNSIEHVDACLPITSLKEFKYGNSTLLLRGQGPIIAVLNADDNSSLCEIRVFKRNNVHGFMVNRSKSHDGVETEILVWGGQSLRIINFLGYEDDHGALIDSHVTYATAEHVGPDWIFDACAAHVTDKDTFAYIVTAHNAVLKINLTKGISTKYSQTIHLRQLAAGVKSALFSADILALSESHILIAAGTVFGEIIVWSCFLNSFQAAVSSIHHFFTGHEGSIFGVDISGAVPSREGGRSGRFLASCSDDRTIRIWDISDSCYASSADPSAYSTDGFELRSTGFGNTVGSEVFIAKAWGHTSRIWSVSFLPIPSEYFSQVNLISRGEDATCHLWRLESNMQPHPQTTYSLEHISLLQQHCGKNIWSSTISDADGDIPVIYTGGADGAIRAFQLKRSRHGNMTIPAPGTDSSRQVGYSTSLLGKILNSKVATENTLKVFAFVAHNHFIAVSTAGTVQLGQIALQSLDKSEEKPNVSWKTLLSAPDLRSFSSISSLPEKGLAIIGGIDGTIRLYDHSHETMVDLTNVDPRPIGLFLLEGIQSGGDNSTSVHEITFVVECKNSDHASLFIVRKGDQPLSRVEKIRLLLPASFALCSASFVCAGEYLVLGGKFGGIVVYKMDRGKDDLAFIWCDHRAHGKSNVTFIHSLTSWGYGLHESKDYLLTFGRDGNYCVYMFQSGHDLKPLQEPQLIHRSSTSFGHLEGAYFDGTTMDFMLYGYRSSNFVLWNETTQTEEMSFFCGGVHRSWAFSASPDSPGSGVILWNQASSFNVVITSSATHKPIRVGSHGREIKSLAIANLIQGSKVPLIASGGEDTVLRISAPARSRTQGVWGSLRCVRILPTHQAGVQHIAWSRDGRFLFSSGGHEEFFVWRIRSIPVFGTAAILEASSPKEAEHSDLRVTSFDVIDIEAPSGDDMFLFCLACSNSTLKVFLYVSKPNSRMFILLGKGTYTTNCLTQIRFLNFGSLKYLVTGATDGHLALWDLNSLLDPGALSSKSVGMGPDPDSKTPVQTIHWQSRFSIHSSSIKCLDNMRVSQDREVVLAGGDDNSLSVTLLEFDKPTNELSVTTVSIPNAHASTVTAIKILDYRPPSAATSIAEIKVASSGNDQRIKFWSITISGEKRQAEAINVAQEIDRYCPAADISAMDIVKLPSDDGNTTERNLLVAGVGMEILVLKD